jgi:hypothetical protein
MSTDDISSKRCMIKRQKQCKIALRTDKNHCILMKSENVWTIGPNAAIENQGD